MLDGLPDDTLVVDLGLGCDLPSDHDHSRLGHRLTCNLAVGVLSEVGVQDGVGDLVAHLVGVSLADGLRCEEELVVRVGLENAALVLRSFGGVSIGGFLGGHLGYLCVRPD